MLPPVFAHVGEGHPSDWKKTLKIFIRMNHDDWFPKSSAALQKNNKNEAKSELSEQQNFGAANSFPEKKPHSQTAGLAATAPVRATSCLSVSLWIHGFMTSAVLWCSWGKWHDHVAPPERAELQQWYTGTLTIKLHCVHDLTQIISMNVTADLNIVFFLCWSNCDTWCVAGREEVKVKVGKAEVGMGKVVPNTHRLSWFHWPRSSGGGARRRTYDWKFRDVQLVVGSMFRATQI